MNEIAVTVRTLQDECDAKPYLRVEVEIDDYFPINYSRDGLGVDLVELAKTLDTDGEFFIITCSCGDPGCAGITEGVHVTRDKHILRWVIPDHGKGAEPEKHFTFDVEAYRTTVKQGIVQFMQLYDGNPGIGTAPYLLRDRIEFAKEQNMFEKWLAA
jgi:hypothetical protein